MLTVGTCKVNNVRSFGWGRLWSIVAVRKRALLYVLLLMIAEYLIALVPPIATQKAIDGANSRTTIDLAWLLIIAGLAFFGQTVCGAKRHSLVAKLCTFVDRRLSRSAFCQMIRRRADGRDYAPGHLQYCLQQLDALRHFVVQGVPEFVFGLGAAAISLVVMLYYDQVIAVVVLVFAVVSAEFSRRRSKHAKAGVEADFRNGSRCYGILSETVTAFSAVKAHGLESIQYHRWRDAIEDLLRGNEYLSLCYHRAAMGVQLHGTILALAILGLGCWRIANERLSVGELMALQMLAGRVMSPIMTAASIVQSFQEANLIVQQLRDLWAEQKENPEILPVERPHKPSEIELIGVTLTYTATRPAAISDISCKFPDRGIVAIVGKNGSGKSTLMHILLGLERNHDGRILVGGADLRSFRPRHWRSTIGIVTQDTFLFGGTVRQNVDVSGKRGDDELRAALRRAGALEFVDALPLGLSTVLETRGEDLSGGQRQRIALARAFIKDPSIVILDEPSSFLDPEAVASLEKSLIEWSRDRLLILISHNMALTRSADSILVLQEGRLEGAGSHNQLLGNCSSYAALWSDYIRSTQSVDEA
ncbi:ABC-type bacteriocin/lantibiotic exporter with double-glycine peptidase domain [Bradyrhizobium sp. F1.2.2]